MDDNVNDPQTLWREYFKLFSIELKRLSMQFEANDKKLDKIKDDIEAKLDKIKDTQITPFQIETSKEIARLNVKAGIWGLVGGSVPIIMLVLIELLKKSSSP